MPNWCTNRLEVSSNDAKALKRFREKVKGETTELSLNKLVPMPKRLDECNWNEWRWSNWGTKRDVGVCLVEEYESKIVYEFDSVGAPPIEWLYRVTELYPELEFFLDYDEPGSCFKGEIIAEGGEIVADDREFY